MNTRTPPLWISTLTAAVLLAGCTQGDFGEVRPLLVRDGIHDWMSDAALPGPSSTFELTDDERQLRDLAYPLIEPPYDRKQWYSVFNEYGVNAENYRAGPDRTAYAHDLLSTRYRSTSTRYAKLIEDARNDLERIPGFFEVTARVLDTDRKRQAALAYVTKLSAAERNTTLRRIRENAAVARWAHSSLSKRHASYRYALERLVIMTPSQQAIEAERVLNQLQTAIARYHIGPPPVSKGGDRVASTESGPR